LKAAGPEVTLKVALTLAPGATGPAISEVLFSGECALVAATLAVHCLGKEMPSVTLATGAPVVFVKVRVVSCEDSGENV
jgi:hypothetical protein